MALLISSFSMNEAVRRLCGELAAEVTNIVLIGMPGCGKSTVGRIVARLTGRPLVDIDGQIEARAGMSIPDLFARFGEKRFRELEAQTLADEGRVGGRVIATGGGAVLREENYPSLKQNGRIYHLNRARELLACGGRPLSRSPEAVAEMERTRAPLYRRFRDVTTDNSQPPEAAAEQIVEEFYEHFGR